MLRCWWHSPEPAHRTKKVTVDTTRVHARGPDDALEAQYAGLERLCCIDGYVYVGRVVESPHDLDGEVVEYLAGNLAIIDVTYDGWSKTGGKRDANCM